MGALVEGFETARQKHETQLAEARARDHAVGDQLQALAKILDEDAAFGISHAVRARTMHIDEKRAPMITIHFDPAEKAFTLTFMKDGSHLTCATPADAAKAIGGHLYDRQRQK